MSSTEILKIKRFCIEISILTLIVLVFSLTYSFSPLVSRYIDESPEYKDEKLNLLGNGERTEGEATIESSYSELFIFGIITWLSFAFALITAMICFLTYGKSPKFMEVLGGFEQKIFRFLKQPQSSLMFLCISLIGLVTWLIVFISTELEISCGVSTLCIQAGNISEVAWGFYGIVGLTVIAIYRNFLNWKIASGLPDEFIDDAEAAIDALLDKYEEMEVTQEGKKGKT
ncbi:MAG: hypothetical protein KAR35_01300 [Candidatus Heimdallarchaeota archaeon]|nr:hypothetical protein [Candidatus Heimdallarchaeota archaeon]MCK5047991.1 hypothetical protein [Candidatus Heimdallarchaeota archaeon]